MWCVIKVGGGGGAISMSLDVNGLERVVGEFKVAGMDKRMGERLLSPVTFVMWSC